jgi:nucleotide-binding universal stress UspA family protein
MPKTIIVPLDGSDQATTALPTASWLADRFDADLRLMTATTGRDSVRERATLHHAALLAGDAPSTHVVVGQPPADAIVATAEQSPDSVICMATQGHGATGSTRLGHVAQHVLDSATGPVVLVGPRHRDELDDPQDLVALVTDPDGRDELLASASEWAHQLDLRLHVVQVVDGDEAPATPLRSEEVEVGLTISVRHGTLDADDVTVGLAHGLDAALLVVAADGASRPADEDIVGRAHCPVLVVPTDASRGRRRDR